MEIEMLVSSARIGKNKSSDNYLQTLPILNVTENNKRVVV